MKNLFKSLALVAVSALAVVSCQKSELTDQNDGEGIFFSLRTGDAGKTYIEAGDGKFLPMWMNGDEIGVLFEGFEEDDDPAGTLANVADDGKEADFQGTISGAPEEGNLYAFYPSAIAKAYDNQAVGFDILETQNPTATSFDPAADLLISKPVCFSADESGNVSINDVKFARALAMLKINVYSADFEDIQGQYLSKLTVTAVDGRLAGRPVFDLSAGDAKITTYNKPGVSVAAEYEEDIVCVGSSKTATGCSVFLMVAPETLNKDAKLKFTGITSGYTISKEVTLPGDIVLTPGKCTEINLGLKEENCKPIIKADWKIVTDVNDLSSGDLIKIGCSSKEAAAGALYNTNKYFTKVSATFSEDGTMMDSAEAAILVLGGDATNGWSLWVGGNQVGYSGEDLALNDKLWTISITETGATTIAEKETHTNTMQYNSSSPRFKPYSTNQAAIQIYKFQGTREQLPAPAIVDAGVDQEKANQINVSWNDVENAAEYEVVFTAGDVDVVEKVETTSIEKGGLEFDTEYFVKVKAIPSDHITYTDSDYSSPVNVKTNPKPAGLVYYKKVTSSLDDWSGEYLIVAESAKKVLTYSKNSTTGYKAADVDNSNSQIESNADTDANKVIIEKNGTAYSVCINGAYLSKPSNSGKIAEVSEVESDAARWTPSTSGLVNKGYDSWSLRYNSGVQDANGPFRIYSSTTGAAVSLYKLDDPRTPLDAPEVTVVANSKEKSITVSWTSVLNAGSYSVTCGEQTYEATQMEISHKFTELVPGDYTITVQANPSDQTKYKPGKTSKTATIEDLTPEISYTSPSTADAEATSLEFAYTITNPVEGQSLSVTITEGGDWITAASADANNVKVSFGKNTTSAVRTGKVTLSYPGAKADKVVTITQNGAVVVYNSLAELVAAGKPSSTAVTVKVTLTNEVIQTKASSYIILKSGTQSVKLYKSGVPSGWSAGGTVSGTLTCPWLLYGSDWELMPNSWDDLTYKAPLEPCANPVIALDGAEATITCATQGATIKYGIGDTQPALDIVYTGPVTLTDGQTIWAQATYDGEYKPSEVVSKKYTAGGGGETYVLCTSTSDLVAGAKYIIASGNSGDVVCISNVSNNNNRKTVAETVSDSKIDISDTQSVMTLTLGGTTGNWTLFTDNYAGTNGYLASAASGSNNYCRVISTETKCTITFSNKAAVITLNPHASRNILRYNSSADCFACYSSGQAAIYLYKKSN